MDQQQSTSDKAGRGWAIVGILCGILAFGFAPVILGPVGIILGIIGRRKGDNALGLSAIIISAVGLAVGLVIGAVIGALGAGGVG